MIKIELPGKDGAEVITLSLVRESKLGRRLLKKCTHVHVTVDTSLKELECNDCKEKLNPVDWIAEMISEWYRIQDITRRHSEAAALYAAKQRCRCEHCNRITKINPPTPADSSVRSLQPG